MTIRWAATSLKTDRWLLAYFRAQVIYTVVLGVCLLSGLTGWQYELGFTVLTVCILTAAAGFVWECLREYPTKWLILIQSLALPNMLIVGAHAGLTAEFSTVPSYIWISLGESAILMTLGIIMAPIAIFTRRGVRVPAIVLSILWLLQGAYEYGFTLIYPLHQELLKLLNEFVPTVLVCAAFLIIGWQQRAIENG